MATKTDMMEQSKGVRKMTREILKSQRGPKARREMLFGSGPMFVMMEKDEFRLAQGNSVTGLLPEVKMSRVCAGRVPAGGQLGSRLTEQLHQYAHWH